MLATLKTYAAEINAMLAAGKTLREISCWSYAEREAGRPVPYLSISNIDDENTVRLLIAAPTKAEKSLHAFFAETVPGCRALKRYVFRVDCNGVLFTERFSKTDAKSLL